MLRSLNGGRRCDDALLTRTVGNMRWSMSIWMVEEKNDGIVSRICADAAVKKPGTDVAPKPPDRTLPFNETIDWLAYTTPDPTFFSFPRQHRMDSRTAVT